MSDPASRRIFVAGHRGMVGQALCRALAGAPHAVLTEPRHELDLTDTAALRGFFAETRPDTVILAAARVGGIQANLDRPADFIADNLAIYFNVIVEARAAGVTRLLNIASSAIYPAAASQPMAEEALMTGPLDPSHAPYATAKIAAIELCAACNRQYGTDYRTVAPCNLYGPGDTFDPKTSHVIPALLRRFHEAVASGAKEVTIWGSGTPRREFLHVDDMADGALFVLGLPPERLAGGPAHLNLGAGEDVSIAELAGMIAGVTGFRGKIRFDASKPDGVARKLLDVRRLTGLGWRARIGLRDGLIGVYGAGGGQTSIGAPSAT